MLAAGHGHGKSRLDEDEVPAVQNYTTIKRSEQT
jgi:hypothetical protein